MDKLGSGKIKLDKTVNSLGDILERSIRAVQSQADSNGIVVVGPQPLSQTNSSDAAEQSSSESERRSRAAERRLPRPERRKVGVERRWLDGEGRPMRTKLPPEGERRSLEGDRRIEDQRLSADRRGERGSSEDNQRSPDKAQRMPDEARLSTDEAQNSPDDENQAASNLQTTLKVDADKINLVLVNLLGAAIKHSKRGETIRIETRTLDEWLEISVVGTDFGMATKQISMVFSQSETPASSPQAEGSGLGLAICKAIVEAHGGKIGMDSNADTGSSFWFRLPSSCFQ